MNPAREEIARRLAAGTRIDRIADLVGVDRRTVIGVAHATGYRITAHGTAELIGDQPMTPVPTPPPLQPARRSTIGEVALAVNELTRHKDARVRKQAERTITQVRRLVDVLSEYDEKAAARAEVERLEQQLRDAKAKLRGSGEQVPLVGPAVDSKAIRAWAARNGVDCPSVGPVPQRVVDAYQAAQSAA